MLHVTHRGERRKPPEESLLPPARPRRAVASFLRCAIEHLEITERAPAGRRFPPEGLSRIKCVQNVKTDMAESEGEAVVLAASIANAQIIGACDPAYSHGRECPPGVASANPAHVRATLHLAGKRPYEDEAVDDGRALIAAIPRRLRRCCGATSDECSTPR